MAQVRGLKLLVRLGANAPSCHCAAQPFFALKVALQHACASQPVLSCMAVVTQHVCVRCVHAMQCQASKDVTQVLMACGCPMP